QTLSWRDRLKELSGFYSYTNADGKIVRGKTLWDWMGLLLVPAFIAGAIAWYDNQNSLHQQAVQMAEATANAIAVAVQATDSAKPIAARSTDSAVSAAAQSTDSAVSAAIRSTDSAMAAATQFADSSMEATLQNYLDRMNNLIQDYHLGRDDE